MQGNLLRTIGIVGVILALLGAALLAAATLASAVQYNLDEQPEGSFTGPVPAWIVVLGSGSAALALIGLVLAACALTIALVRRRHRRE